MEERDLQGLFESEEEMSIDLVPRKDEVRNISSEMVTQLVLANIRVGYTKGILSGMLAWDLEDHVRDELKKLLEVLNDPKN